MLPGVFSISSTSPVNSDSFTWMLPLMTTASAQICFPADNKTISSFTRSCDKIFCSLPSLNTSVCGALRRFIFSSVFFARSSCTIPITVFPIIIGRNVRFLKDPTTISNIEIIKNMRLKYVHTFDNTISLLVLSVFISALFTSPLSTLVATSASLSPTKTGLFSSILSIKLSFILFLHLLYP